VLTFREADMQDCEQVLAWRNDPMTRFYSLNPKEIAEAEHLVWYQNSLAIPERKMLIILDGCMAIGVLRLDLRDADRLEVSINLAPEARNRGYGTSALQEICQPVKKWFPRARLVEARIKSNNAASIRVFAKAGFQFQKREGDVILMTLSCD